MPAHVGSSKNLKDLKDSRWAARNVGAGLWAAAHRPIFIALRLMQNWLASEYSQRATSIAAAFYYTGYFLIFFHRCRGMVCANTDARRQEHAGP